MKKIVTLFAFLICAFSVFSQENNPTFSELVAQKYSARVSYLNETDFTIVYSDSTRIIARKLNGSYVIEGDHIGENRYTITELDVSEDASPLEHVSIEIAARNPCGSHPKNEAFSDCFVREWRDFCDSWISCLAQAIKPVEIAIAITIHCLACK